ncbi:hypothetical protein [Paraburkholderia elongata]|uniref:Uncharacterized protein n=1 Tax=Paraburkholderia elongata TaxID=2675747 RepID=A0A972SJA9_9BURK|nr:hypothetical protein [Paraburkholderia elongata]NPT56909.1 hypothetical protein [Paraburkholderia elongata]
MQPLLSVVTRVRRRGATPSSSPARWFARLLRAALVTLNAAAASSSEQTFLIWNALALAVPQLLAHLDAFHAALAAGSSRWN